MTGTIVDKSTANNIKDENKFNSEALFIQTYNIKKFVEFPVIFCHDINKQNAFL